MPNKMERFTQRARRALSMAEEAAAQFDHGEIGAEHLLIGLVREEGGVAGRVLRELGLNRQMIEDEVRAASHIVKRRAGVQPELSSTTKKVLELAVDEARRMGHFYIGTEHLLLGAARLDDDSPPLTLLRQLNITSAQVRTATRRALRESPIQTQTEPRKSTLPDRRVSLVFKQGDITLTLVTPLEQLKKALTTLTSDQILVFIGMNDERLEISLVDDDEAARDADETRE